MTTDRALDLGAVEAALALAVRAPSIHNTQPWRWVWDGAKLRLRADRSRQLQVADPDGHSMLISCGAALHLTQLGLRAAGFVVNTEVLPDPSDPDLLAVFQSVAADDVQPVPQSVLAEADAALRRRSDRRPYTTQQVPRQEVELLREAASGADAYVDFPHDEDQRINLAVAVSWADRVERHYHAYEEEMQRWLRDPNVHATADGIPLTAVPHVDPGHPRHTDVPVRDFEVGVVGSELIAQDQDEKPIIAIVFTHYDTAADHLSAGSSMMRLMIAAELAGLASCPLSQAVDLPAFRGRMQPLMGWTAYPQMMLRIGYPSGPPGELAPTPRRPVSAVLDMQT